MEFRRRFDPLNRKGKKQTLTDLSCVEKVSELRLPDDEVGGTLHRHSVLEAHHGLLGEVAVGHLEPATSWKWTRVTDAFVLS